MPLLGTPLGQTSGSLFVGVANAISYPGADTSNAEDMSGIAQADLGNAGKCAPDGLKWGLVCNAPPGREGQENWSSALIYNALSRGGEAPGSLKIKQTTCQPNEIRHVAKEPINLS